MLVGEVRFVAHTAGCVELCAKFVKAEVEERLDVIIASNGEDTGLEDTNLRTETKSGDDEATTESSKNPTNIAGSRNADAHPDSLPGKPEGRNTLDEKYESKSSSGTSDNKIPNTDGEKAQDKISDVREKVSSVESTEEAIKQSQKQTQQQQPIGQYSSSSKASNFKKSDEGASDRYKHPKKPCINVKQEGDKNDDKEKRNTKEEKEDDNAKLDPGLGGLARVDKQSLINGRQEIGEARRIEEGAQGREEIDGDMKSSEVEREKQGAQGSELAAPALTNIESATKEEPQCSVSVLFRLKEDREGAQKEGYQQVELRGAATTDTEAYKEETGKDNEPQGSGSSTGKIEESAGFNNEGVEDTQIDTSAEVDVGDAKKDAKKEGVEEAHISADEVTIDDHEVTDAEGSRKHRAGGSMIRGIADISGIKTASADVEETKKEGVKGSELQSAATTDIEGSKKETLKGTELQSAELLDVEGFKKEALTGTSTGTQGDVRTLEGLTKKGVEGAEILEITLNDADVEGTQKRLVKGSASTGVALTGVASTDIEDLKKEGVKGSELSALVLTDIKGLRKGFEMKVEAEGKAIGVKDQDNESKGDVLMSDDKTQKQGTGLHVEREGLKISEQEGKEQKEDKKAKENEQQKEKMGKEEKEKKEKEDKEKDKKEKGEKEKEEREKKESRFTKFASMHLYKKKKDKEKETEKDEKLKKEKEEKKEKQKDNVENLKKEKDKEYKKEDKENVEKEKYRKEGKEKEKKEEKDKEKEKKEDKEKEMNLEGGLKSLLLFPPPVARYSSLSSMYSYDDQS